MEKTDVSPIPTKEQIRISVRKLVEFLLRDGDIDNRFQGMVEGAMQEGSRIHRAIQKRMGAEYQAEVPLNYVLDAGEYDIFLEGRADGIIDNEGEITIDEIKGTYRDIYKIRKPIGVHLAQAKCYAYMYCCQCLPDTIKNIRVRMTYVNIETEDIRYFYEEYPYAKLEEWFLNLLEEYKKWASYRYTWSKIRQKSLEQLEFPFPYRDGQRDLVSYVYQTIYHQKKLFIEAPTGVGKTISTIFPALKAMGKGMGENLFYLTAKTITRTVADDTFKLLRDKGLQFKSIILTAKEKICFEETMLCNPDHCPYARGHYDRVNDAMYDMLIHEDSFDREKIEFYAKKHQVCPFEFGLDMSLYADGIICDYNYLFDPHIYLKRFFAEGVKGDYLFLIDEAHNLLDRGREMYSADLERERLMEVRRALKTALTLEREKKEEILETQGADNQEFQLTLDMTLGTTSVSKTKKKPRKSRKKVNSKLKLVTDGYGDRIVYHLDKCIEELQVLRQQNEDVMINPSIEELVKLVERLYGVLAEYMEENEEEKNEIHDVLLDLYFDLSHFLLIYDKRDENYVIYTSPGDGGGLLVRLFCVNPRENLKECMLRGRSTILFSATLLPIQYYKELLGGDAADYEVYAKSVFSKEKRGLYIGTDVTTKYTRRTEEEFQRYAAYINEIVTRRQGNYLVFCPSYSFMERVLEAYKAFYETDEVECIVQKDVMTEEDRELFLTRFRGNGELDFTGLVDMEIDTEEEHSLLGFCVLGGIFGEGIDLKNDSLIGAIIIGTGLPLKCIEREILKDYFDDRGESGFDYAYRYPGMNKVLQAAGRVIRTSEDIGVIALLDERFPQISNRKLFPREWENYKLVNLNTIGNQIELFWDSWGKYQ